MLESMLEGYAEYYSAELAGKVIRGMTENALKCKYNGAGVPLGFVIDNEQHYQVDPVTAPLVVEVFNLYADGTTIIELVKLLNDREIKSRRDGKISIDIIKRMLTNRRYIGEYSYRDVVVPNGIPQIISEDLFNRVQERMDKNKKAPARFKAEDKYLLTTKLFCGKCGRFMVGESGTSQTMKVHHYYRCVNTKKKKLCDKKTVKKDWIENLVVTETMNMLNDDKVILQLVDTLYDLQQRESSDLPLLRQQLSDADKAIQNMLNAIQQGVFTSSTKQRLEELEETKSSLEISIVQEEMQKPTLTKEQMTYWICRFRKYDVTKQDQRERLIDTFVNAIFLYDDRIKFVFNFKDGAKTVTFDEINSSDLEGFGAPTKTLIYQGFFIFNTTDLLAYASPLITCFLKTLEVQCRFHICFHTP